MIPEDIHVQNTSGPRIDLDNTIPSPALVFSHRQRLGTEPVIKSFNVLVVDVDDVTLTAAAFIDGRYASPVPLPYDQIRPVPDVLRGRRSFIFDISNLCDEEVNFELGLHTFELYISDSGFVSTGDDRRIPLGQGQRDNVLWRYNCIPPTPMLDGGV